MGFLQKKVPLSTLLKLQLFYCLLGVGYNVVSYSLVISIGRRLSSTAPFTGGLVMAFYGLCLITGYKGLHRTYRVLMLGFVVVIGYNGFIKHFILYARQPEVYFSFLAWFAAAGNNFFGILLNLIAAAGRFEPARVEERAT
jgi:hypothetical protein